MLQFSLIFISLCALSAILFVIVQIQKGKDDADRIVALDILLAAALILCIVAALMIERTVLLDVAIGLSLVGFIGTVGWSAVIRRKNDNQQQEQLPEQPEKQHEQKRHEHHS
ncbi:multicomponent Na+:H+ antiporter subunit F [Pasteurella testudinis DSM 23072]|uniref:Multicomponent Na+:H+ antiporter subunit F n=1 Tax=Pasteurella testudinis DSM 23072 TaxID=1122938 RepID=A0A1W1UMP3_9PAST|nr:monovalent cation/H+ antiporter complex subunit F [Pasteurella testudinis]SMB82071.1 multicomponent Na+:H+ antiporter subunit F [Pasteurella testudinis DSM 23072]SUB52372.1 putative monovalent cation/H+ antiporter subunit F [Pasteurella testudinis]